MREIKLTVLLLLSCFLITANLPAAAEASFIDLLNDNSWPDIAMFESALKAGADPNTTDSDGRSALTLAINQQRSDVVAFLLNNGADVNLADNWQRTPLHLAAKLKQNYLPALIEAGADIEAVASGAYTPLMYAMSGSSPVNAALLLEQGARIDVRDDLGRTPLHLACISRKLNAVYFALEAGADIEARDSKGYTPILTLLKNRGMRDETLEIFDYLLAKRASIHAVADNGDGVLQLADKDHLLIKVLIERGARLQFPDSIPEHSENARGVFFLHCLQNNRTAMARYLLLEPDPAFKQVRTENGETALHLAVTRNDKSLVTELIKAGFDPNATRSDGATPLHLAIRGFGRELAPILLQAGARTDIPDQKGDTVMILADRAGDSDLYAMLSTFRRFEPKTGDTIAAASETSLLAAIKKNLRLTVERLLLNAPDVSERDEEGNSALHFSISRYSREWATAMIKAGADPTAANKEGITPLHLAAREGNIRLTRLFLERGALVDVTDKNGRTPLFYAVQQRHFLLAEILLSCGAHVNHCDKNGKTPLFQAVGADPLLVTFSWLVKKGAAINTSDNDGNTVFHELMRTRPSKWAVKCMIGFGADLLKLNRWGDSPFSRGMRHSTPEVLEFLFEQKPDYGEIASSGLSILHNWASNGEIDLLARGLAGGGDANLVDRKGEPLLFAALRSSNASAAALLIENGANIECTNASGVTLLENAIQLGKIKMLPLLLSAGIDTNRVTSNGLPPLWRAVGRWKMFDLLLDYGARAEFSLLSDKKFEKVRDRLVETSDGIAALRRLQALGCDLRPLVFPGETEHKQVFNWAGMGNIEGVKLACDLGFDIKTADKGGHTLLHRAARNGRVEMVRKLIEWGAPLEAMNNEGKTPLSHAVDGYIHSAVTTLIDAGANTQLKTGDIGASLLHEIVSSGTSPEVIDRLIAAGIDIDSPDSCGGTPLLWAANDRSYNATAHLLKLGANPNIATVVASYSEPDPNSINAEQILNSITSEMKKWPMNGITPLARAVAKKDQNITRMLLNHGARIDLADSFGNTPMHIALLNNSPELAKLMLAYNPPLFMRNIAGKNIIELADENGHIDIAFALWKKIPADIRQNPDKPEPSDQSQYPLHEAVRNNELTRLRWLVRGGRRVEELDDKKLTPMLTAIDSYRDQAVKVLLQLNASVNYSPRGSDTPWISAVRKGRTEIVEAMAQAGVDINFADKDGDTALHLAARSHRTAMIERLIRLKADPSRKNKHGRTPLMEAVVKTENPVLVAKKREYLEKINAKLLAKDRRIRKRQKGLLGKKTKKLDTRSDRTQAIEALVIKHHPSFADTDIYGHTALHLAARNSDAEVINLLVNAGCEVAARDRTGRTPAYHAIITDNLDALSELVTLGANVNIADNRGETPLSLCDSLNRIEIAIFLRQAGAAPASVVPRWPDDSSRKEANLIRAVRENRPQAVRYLLEHRALLEETDGSGETALFHAVRTGNPALVELLLFRGANPEHLDRDGRRPLDLALTLSRTASKKLNHSAVPDSLLDDRNMIENRQRIIKLLSPQNRSSDKHLPAER